MIKKKYLFILVYKFTFRCCNTCEDVKKAYKYKNWVFHPSNIEQCKDQSYENTESPKEGCQIYGTLLVNRVSIAILNMKINIFITY